MARRPRVKIDCPTCGTDTVHGILEDGKVECWRCHTVHERS